MLTDISKKEFRCEACGHRFKAFSGQGGFEYNPAKATPRCPRCGSTKVAGASRSLFDLIAKLFSR